MFQRQSFNLTGFLDKPKQKSRISSVLQSSFYEIQDKERLIFSLQQQNKNLKSQLQNTKLELQNIKQLLISTKIQHDTEIRAYDQLIQQLRTQISQKDLLLQKCAQTLKLNLSQNEQILKIQELINAQDQQEQQSGQQKPQNQQQHQTINQVGQLQLESTLGQTSKQAEYYYEIQLLKTQCERLKKQLETIKQKNSKNQITTTNDVSFNSKPIISFDLGDLTAELQKIQEIAQLNNHVVAQSSISQNQMQIFEERIQNLQRLNVELQQQVALKSHKIATIFNAALQFGGTQLIEYLHDSIGLVESKIAEEQS